MPFQLGDKEAPEAAIGRGLPAIASAGLGDDIYISNATPYSWVGDDSAQGKPAALAWLREVNHPFETVHSAAQYLGGAHRLLTVPGIKTLSAGFFF